MTAGYHVRSPAHSTRTCPPPRDSIQSQARQYRLAGRLTSQLAGRLTGQLARVRCKPAAPPTAGSSEARAPALRAAAGRRVS